MARMKQRGNNIRAALADALSRGQTIGRKRLQIDEEVLKLRKEGFSYRAIAFELGHTIGPIRRICTEAGLNKLRPTKYKPDAGRSTETDGNRPWLNFK